MAWDASRPVPWQRLIRDWLLYMAVAMVVMLVVARDQLDAGVIAGLLLSGPLFVGLGVILAKFGYRRQTMRELREQRAAIAAAKADEQRAAGTAPATSRARPAPTKRTSGGGNRPPTKHRKR